MKDKLFVAVTGYYGTGSSAVLDLLKEYHDVNIASPVSTEYEHIPLYYPGGLFDMYSILSSDSCSVYNSDMAINRFIQAAHNLNDYDYGWIGSYKKHYKDQYMAISYDLVNKISRKTGRQSAGHMYKVRFSIIKAILQMIARIVIKRPITKLGRHYVTDSYPGYYSMPSKKILNSACKEYVTRYMEMCSDNSSLNVFDHLLWPQQCKLIDALFPSSFKAIIVNRDPRDVFLLNKYYWHKPPVTISKPYYPTDVKIFCKEWKESIRRTFDSAKVTCLFFEDLIYNYDETVKKIESFLNITAQNHIYPKDKFIPKMSIENTQIFLANKEWLNEVAYIENELNEYLYSFPYERVPDKAKWFDTEAQLKKIKKSK